MSSPAALINGSSASVPTTSTSSHYRPSDTKRPVPAQLHTQLDRNLHLHNVSPPPVSATSAPGMLEDDDYGDIALSIPRSRSDRALASNLQRAAGRSESASPGAHGLDSQRTRPPTASSLALARAAQAASSSAPTSPQGDRSNHHLDCDTPQATSSSWSPRAIDVSPTRRSTGDHSTPTSTSASLVTPTPSTPPSVPTLHTTEYLSPPNQGRRQKYTRSHSYTALSIDTSQTKSEIAQRLGASTSVAKDRGDLAVDPDADGQAASPRPPPLVEEETARSMSRWVKEIVVCNFDLERGPVVERRIIGRRWGPGLKENIAFSAFPDTSLFTEGSIQFSFKVRDIPPTQASLAFPEPPSPRPDATNGPVLKHSRGSSLSREKEAEYRSWDERGREWLYGYVWFQQKKDRGIARGFMQKSVVILTHLPLPALFSAMLSRIAPAFFDHGYTAIEVACHSIASWPDPQSDTLLELPLLTDILSVKMPDKTENAQVAVPSRGPQPILASLPASTPLRAFSTFLPSLWSIWECLVLAEPLLIIAPDPKTCSEVVWWLRELVRPLPLAGDFRPYLHIHDHDFSLLVNASKPQAGVVVGVTNPFFRNAASHWPNVVSIPGAAKPKTPSMPKQEAPEGFISRRGRSVSKDRALLKRLEALVAAGKLDDPDGNAALRTYFQQLTERMLVPLNRYFQTLVPPRSPLTSGPTTPQHQLQLQLHHPRPQPGLNLLTNSPRVQTYNGNLTPVHPGSPALTAVKPFSLPSFLQHLRNRGPNPLAFKARGITSKSRVESDFYASFCKSSTFAGWLSARVESLGIAVASNMVQDAIAAAAAMRMSPDPYAAERASDRSSTEVSGTTASSCGSLRSPTTDDEGTTGDDAATPRPKGGPDPFASHRRFVREAMSGTLPTETMTPTRSRPKRATHMRQSSLPRAIQ